MHLADPSKLLARPDLATRLISRFAADDDVATAIGKTLHATSESDVQMLILSGIAASDTPPLHASWTEPLAEILATTTGTHRQGVIDAIAAIDTEHFNEALESIGRDSSIAPLVRVSTLAAVQKKSGVLGDATFELLRNFASDTTQPTASLRAAQLIAASNLNSERLRSLAPLTEDASPLQLRELVRCFARTKDPQTIEQFLDSIGRAKWLLSLAPNELSDSIKRYPPALLPRANELLGRLKRHQAAKTAKLATLSTRLSDGDPDRGRTLFHSAKAKCNTCHRVNQLGKRVGPDLTKIGANRSANDLLESIVFPSASIVRDYETLQVLTDDGQVYSGLLSSESTIELEIQQASGETVTIRRTEIEDIATSPTSVMPSAIEESLSEQELADVVSYLMSLR